MTEDSNSIPSGGETDSGSPADEQENLDQVIEEIEDEIAAEEKTDGGDGDGSADDAEPEAASMGADPSSERV